MLRTLPLPRDIKTVAILRPRPAKKPLSFAAPLASGRNRRPCSPFPALIPRSGDEENVDPEQQDGATASTSPYRTGAIIGGKYRLMRQLGRGGMGEVWRAEHLALNTEVAVKFLSTDAGGRAARVALERFHFEAQVSAHLGLRTAHVVAVHDAGSDAAGPYLVMEYVRGHTLRAELNRRGQLDLAMVESLIDQVAEALSVAHEFGIVHRDLKPSNLLLLEQPNVAAYVKVADFGIAKALRDDLGVDLPEDTYDGWMLGSPAYMSPEQTGGGGIDTRTDLWALGVIAYEALTGRLPFPGRSVAEIIVNMSAGRFDLPSKIRPSLPVELDDWFLRALARRKEQRFGSMAEMARAFHAAVAARPRRRLPRLARGLAIATSLAAALVALRPLPSEALSEAVPTAVSAAMPAEESRPTGAAQVDTLSLSSSPLGVIAAAPSVNQAATLRPSSRISGVIPSEGSEAHASGPTTVPKKVGRTPRLSEAAAPGSRPVSSARTPAPAPTKPHVLTEVF
jgi:eukaryotic-like serine/threonine-protein kinase